MNGSGDAVRTRPGAPWAGARPGPVALIALSVLVMLIVAGCGGGDEPKVAARDTRPGRPGAPFPLDGRTFVSTEVTGHRLVAGTRVSISFEDGRISARAGCNTMAGPYRVDGSTLLAGPDLASTMMGCEAPLMDQDRWLGELLTAGPEIALSGDHLTLRGPSATIVLDEPAPAGDVPLVGTVWRLDTITDGGTASNVPAGVEAPTLSIGEDGGVSVSTGCNTGGAHLDLDGRRGTFGPLRLTKMACDGAAAEVEAAVTAVLDGEVQLGVEGDRLTIEKGARGLVYRASASGGAGSAGDGVTGGPGE